MAASPRGTTSRVVAKKAAAKSSPSAKRSSAAAKASTTAPLPKPKVTSLVARDDEIVDDVQSQDAELQCGIDDTSSRLAAGSPQGSRKAPTKKSLVQRVYNTIDSELTKLEAQKGLTSQDRERASRALSQMVNALEKAVEMQREMTKRTPSGGNAKNKEALAHAEDLRREIAERLERLNRKRASVRRSE